MFDLKAFSFINNLIFNVSEWAVKFSFIIYDRNMKFPSNEYTNNSGKIANVQGGYELSAVFKNVTNI